MSMLNVEPTVGSFNKQALETELTQLKDAITLVRIQNDRIVEPIVEPLELILCVSSNSKVTMISRFTGYKLSNRKAGSKGISGDHSRLTNYVDKFIGNVRFRNDQFAAIVGYGDYKLGNTIISKVYYVEGLSYNLFSVGQFCDGGLEVPFRQHTCHIHNNDMVDLLQGSRTTNLYSILLNDMLASSPGKSKKSSHPLQTVNTNTEILNTLHMDLYRPMQIESINKKKYILVIVDDYTRFGWVRFLRTKDETPEVIKKFIMKTQRALNATVCYNDVVERRNRTLMEAVRTMLIFAKAQLFLWAEAVATTCYTLNRSLIHTLHGKTYYELPKGKNSELKYFRVFGSLCYPTNDYDDLGKLKAKTDIGIFVGYAPTKKEYRIFNKRTRKIQETVHVTFDKLSEGMTSAPEITTGSPSMTIITESAPAVFTTSLESQILPPDTGVTGIETPFPT
nr:hypothetical protein [Tanacetum cinerariifolium]